MTFRKRHEFFINGDWVQAAEAPTIEMLNPATEQSIGSIAAGDENVVNAAVAAAKEALPQFSSTSVAERKELLQSILSVYRKRRDEIAHAIMQELGAPRHLAYGSQTAAGESHLDGFLQALGTYKFEETLMNGDLVVREPIGVCGLITPWNWPINQIALKVLPALAAGCTMVLKPSEFTPFNAMLYADILSEAGVPKGVFNLVNGEGPVAGAALSRHPDVAMMSFTGSVRAGAAVSKDAADGVKKVALELGGKSPNLVFADADVDDAVKRGVRQMFNNTGQSCNAPSRMLVEQSIYDRAKEVALKTAEQQEVGNPDDAGRHMGPLVNHIQFDRVQELIKTGMDEGATLLCGGLGKPEGINEGYYVKPTIFVDVRNDMRIAQEEIFGPVLCMIPFEDEQQAIAIANDTEFGLSAYVQTKDEEKAMRVARQLQAGMVHINGSGMAPGSPFGGYKKSGIGREGGTFGLEEFLEVKTITRPKETN
ncbi:aldehyde dehydrogenase family protein [Maritalea mediterranea]|uniref:aldehyde dehydrogenase (NAD(+)) n=1 Tax=Maritalea mediterranea TaxID=2909667 RepID=A0ABS9E8M7_9HYPH|nr:aldehyde dehydrogenase family protein [Maritalea mediterranea]MCF4098264.1 aldehyde dehydrogenase family protein [Maritalea mediterranea]